MKRQHRQRLHRKVRSVLRDTLVLATFIPPVRFILQRVYTLVLERLTRKLATLPYVTEVGLTGSLATGDCVYGASDIDLIVIAEGAPNQGIKRELRRFFKHARRIFPLVGETDERTGNVFFTSEIDTSPYAAIYHCRRKVGNYRVLVDASPASQTGSDSVLGPIEVISEVTLKLKSIASQAIDGTLSLYFWKSKIRVLQRLLASLDPDGVQDRLDRDEAEFVRELHETLNHRLYFRRRAELDSTAWNITGKLIASIVDAQRFASLEVTDLAYQATAAQQLPLGGRSLPGGVRLHEFADHPESFGGDALLNAPVLPYLLLELEDTAWRSFRQACEFAASGIDEDAHVLIWLGDFVAQFHHGRCVGLVSRWERPFLFPACLEDSGRLLYPDIFLESLIDERDADLAYLRDAFYWRVIDRNGSNDAARHSDSLRYFEDRQRTLNGFAFIHLANCLSKRGMVNFGDRDDVLRDASEQHEGHRGMLNLLAEYADRVAKGTLALPGPQQPPGLMRAATGFFADVLFDRPIGDHPVDMKLSLSLCICTRNRASSLAEMLESVVAQSRKPDEVIIIDNGSTDNTASVVESFGSRLPVRYIVDPSQPIARLRNRALDEASGEIVCFSDDDCIVHEHWLHFIEESFLLEEQIGLVGGQVCHLEEQESLVDYFHRAYLGVRL